MTVSEMASMGGKARWRGVAKDERKALASLWGKRGAAARWRKRKRRNGKAARRKN